MGEKTMDRPPASAAAEEEPVTPAGRLFLVPELDQTINVAIGVKDPIDVVALRAVIADSMMMNHPRFSSLLVTDKRGREHWRKTKINLDQHITIHRHFEDPAGAADAAAESEVEGIVNDYLADFSVSRPLSRDKPLWEVHVMSDLRCVIWRLHHSLGDGISMMSLFLECCRRAADPNQIPEMGPAVVVRGKKKKKSSTENENEKRRNWRGKGVIGLLKLVWFTVIYVLEAIGRSLWVSDKNTVLTGGQGVELWPRKIATAKFNLEDMKAVKRAIPNATINDVLCGIISCGLSRYLEVRSAKALQEGLQITGLALVNLRKQPGIQEMSNLMKKDSRARWGNRFGYIILPVYYHKVAADGPLGYVRIAKKMTNRKKQSLEAHFSYASSHIVMSCFGPKVAYRLVNRMICNTTFSLSNVAGPQEEITVIGNSVSYIRVNNSSLSHALSMTMMSYKGRADMQILVAKDIIPDPEFLASCFEDALLQMKVVAADDNSSARQLEV
ncbi:hypothetical protein Dimus_002550 [Dionaea muscipula]